jgi:hypothetical protein
MRRYGVRHAKAALYQWVENSTRQLLQPGAIGAVMEVTKWLMPSITGHRLRALSAWLSKSMQ